MMTLIVSPFIIQILILVNVTYKGDEANNLKSVTHTFYITKYIQ